MAKTEYVYVIYISAKAQQVWDALIKAEFTKKYWGALNVSDWKPGSTWEHRQADSNELMLTGKVVEFAPPRRLVITWAAPPDAAKPAAHSRVAIDLTPMNEMVRVTVTHNELEAGSEMLGGIMEGWPRVLSSLKSMLETGKPLDTWAMKGAK
jgi:uncharacterized protein YndB with AHSA1/START domain